MREYNDRRLGHEGGAGRLEKKKSSWLKKLLIFILVTVLLLFVAVQVLIFRYIGRVTVVQTGERRFEGASMSSGDVLNVLLIGSDSRDPEQRGRTDSMILLSINKKNKQTTMTSLMRDSYVTLPEYDLDGDGSFYSAGDRCKLNAAYVYGGAELLMDTIAYNFDIAVDRYIYIDFYSFIDMIDAVGGIELDISDDEAAVMQRYIKEHNKYTGAPVGTDILTEGGKSLHVNGNQALAYTRVRYVGNADFQRTERQRTVLSKLLGKAREGGVFELDRLVTACADNVVTNFSKWELYGLCYRLPFIAGYELSQLRIPADDEYTFGTGYDGSSVLLLDFDSCIGTLRENIYE